MEGTKIVKAVKKSEFFKDLNNNHIDSIVALCTPTSFETGECVFHQGENGEQLYIIADGRVALERSIDLGNRKGKITIDVLGKGRVLGCWSTILGEPHILMSTAVCQKPSKILAFKGPDLRSLMLSDKELGFNLMERFCILLRERIKAAYGAMEKL